MQLTVVSKIASRPQKGHWRAKDWVFRELDLAKTGPDRISDAPGSKSLERSKLATDRNVLNVTLGPSRIGNRTTRDQDR